MLTLTIQAETPEKLLAAIRDLLPQTTNVLDWTKGHSTTEKAELRAAALKEAEKDRDAIRTVCNAYEANDSETITDDARTQSEEAAQRIFEEEDAMAAAAVQEKAEPPKAEPEPEPAVPTPDQVKAATIAAMAKSTGRALIIATLKSLGVSAISEVTPEMRQRYIEALSA